jgi:preprotein translocase subunit SecD
MLIRLNRFNLYLLTAALLVVFCGCQSAEKKRKKQTAVFRVHIEGRAEETTRTLVVPIYRSAPMNMAVVRSPFITEEKVKHAEVIDTPGGYQLKIELDRQGTYLLEQYTAANREKHLAIFCNFASLTNLSIHVDRWLAAPKITQRISNGILSFTPDADREEAEHIANSLNNVAKKLQTGT